jgi:hypothetical protein
MHFVFGVCCVLVDGTFFKVGAFVIWMIGLLVSGVLQMVVETRIVYCSSGIDNKDKC